MCVCVCVCVFVCALLLCLEQIVLPPVDCSFHVFYGIASWKPEQFHYIRYNNSTTQSGNVVFKKCMHALLFAIGISLERCQIRKFSLFSKSSTYFLWYA